MDVPKEVCTRQRRNPRRVNRPVIKKWCYTPTNDDYDYPEVFGDNGGSDDSAGAGGDDLSDVDVTDAADAGDGGDSDDDDEDDDDGGDDGETRRRRN